MTFSYFTYLYYKVDNPQKNNDNKEERSTDGDDKQYTDDVHGTLDPELQEARDHHVNRVQVLREAINNPSEGSDVVETDG